MEIPNEQIKSGDKDPVTGLFELLFRIDKRENPERYRKNENEGQPEE